MVRTGPKREPDHFEPFGGSSPKFDQVAEPEPRSGPRFKKLGPKTGRNRTTAPLGAMVKCKENGDLNFEDFLVQDILISFAIDHHSLTDSTNYLYMLAIVPLSHIVKNSTRHL
jgi:hypothetical protein